MNIKTKVKKMIDDFKVRTADIWVYDYELRTMLIILTYNDVLVTDIEEGDNITKISFNANRSKMISIESDLRKFYVDVVQSSIEW